MGAGDPERIREYFGSAHWKSSKGREWLVRERLELLRDIVTRVAGPASELAVCDVGCGGGGDLAAWRDAGVPEARLAGTELVPERARIARERLPAADIRMVDGFALPFSTDSFDVCTASLVLSSIRTTEHRRRLLIEMARTTVPGGLVMVYDFTIRKPWNRNVTAITTGGLARLWRAPDEIRRAGPFLPALDLALRLPRPIGRRLIRVLPPTHRLWIWRSR